MTRRGERAAAGWSHGLGRVALVGALGAALVLGADRAGTVAPGLPPPGDERPSAATTATGYCPGNPFTRTGGGGRMTVTGAVLGRAAPAVALEGIVDPSGVPGTISLETLPTSGAGASPARQSGATNRSSSRLSERPVRVRGTQERAPGMAAAQYVIAGGDSAGLAVQACRRPTADAWLVAGGAAKGGQGRLLLTNPGEGPVTAEVTVLGGDTRELRIPGESRAALALDPSEDDAPGRALHVRTRGGRVVPTLAIHHPGAESPSGVETTGPTSPPRTHLVVPGNADTGDTGLVVGVPGGREASVRIRAAGTRPSSETKEVTVDAGTVADVELPEVEGVHAWVIESDEPVVAAGHLRAPGSKDGSDLARTVATPAIGRLGGVALPTEPPEQLRRFLQVTAADGRAQVDVFVLADGRVDSRRLSVGDLRSRTLSVGRADAVWVRPRQGKVHAAVLLVREGGREPAAASMPVLPSRVTRSDTEIVRAN